MSSLRTASRPNATTPVAAGATVAPVEATPERSRPVAGRILAVTRIVLGFVFAWAFLDKTFGLGYSTPAARSWVNGGSPTSGFLGHVDVGPLRSFFHALAGSAVVDWLFMLGLVGVGVALILGVALRPAAVAGTLMMLMMWAAEWPLSRFTAGGQGSGSVNPIVDYHIVYALLLIVLAVFAAGRVWGLGRIWERTSLVERAPWLR